MKITKIKYLFNKNPWDDFQMFKKNLNNKNFKDFWDLKKGFKYSFIGFILIALIIICLWLSTGFYTVEPQEEGVALIFGSYYQTTQPGLHYNIPQPIGKVFKIPVTYINREEIGINSISRKNRRTDDQEVLMITADENMANVQCEIQWRIKNSYEYLFNVKDLKAGETVRNAAESVIREVVGSKNLDYLIEGVGRQHVAENAQKFLQDIADSYKMGVTILSVQMKTIDPPGKVINAFRDVQSARADKAGFINQAIAYKNEIIPKAKGEAAKILAEAEAYEIELVNQANGNIKRLLSIYTEYKQDKEMTQQRIYLDVMHKIIGQNKKIILEENNNNLSLLNMNDLLKEIK